jgi:large subunit ribosomal protein L3
MTVHTRRTGLIATKVGMSQIFNEFGEAIPVTLLKADGNVVVETKTEEKDGYNAVVLGFGEKKASRTSKPLKGKFAKAKVTPKNKIKEFRVSKVALLQPGQEISIEHFVVGQCIDVQGVNIGKGFAGVMKRHNFRGLEATHGVSVSHRSHGSTGQRQDPGRVFKGKKMAGHMGAVTVTTQNIKIVQIDSELGLIALSGAVPGKPGSYVYITDAIKVALPITAQFPAALVSSNAKVEAAPVVEQPQQEQTAN